MLGEVDGEAAGIRTCSSVRERNVHAVSTGACQGQELARHDPKSRDGRGRDDRSKPNPPAPWFVIGELLIYAKDTLSIIIKHLPVLAIPTQTQNFHIAKKASTGVECGVGVLLEAIPSDDTQEAEPAYRHV